VPGTLAEEVYGKDLVYERHRHRYEVNNAYRDALSEAGMVFSGTSPDGRLVEIAEIKDHPFYIGSQFHPEFKSRPLRPHPLFYGFVGACGAALEMAADVGQEAAMPEEQAAR
jgi:CTP synthase